MADSLPPADVTALTHAVRAGDLTALGVLYDRYAAAMYRTAYRLTGSGDDAQDVVHDCFVGLPEALRHYEERGTLEAWLRQVVVRLVLMRNRREGRRRESSLESDNLPPSHLETDAAAEFSDVRRAIDALPASLRVVFVLKQIEGYSHEEIARFEGISPGASRVRLTRALESLRQTLASSS